MNQESSRSHSILSIVVEYQSVDSKGKIRMGKLNLVDLAGSERQSKTESTGNKITADISSKQQYLKVIDLKRELK